MPRDSADPSGQKPVTPTCPMCGYDVSGIFPDRVRFRCPECGALFDRRNDPGVIPFRGGLIMARVCWPCWTTVAAWTVARAAGSHMKGGMNQQMDFVLLTGVVITMFGSPWYMAKRMVRRYIPRAERFVPYLVLTVVGTVINIFSLGMAALLLRWI